MSRRAWLLASVLVGVVFSLLVDRVLGLLGFPSEFEPPITHRPNIREGRRNLEFTYRFETNSQGLRYREIPLRKPEGTVRILVIGDSMVEGHGVEAPDTFSALLERRFTTAGRPVEFINGGLGNTAPVQYGRVFITLGPGYGIDALLICVFANDLADTGDIGGPQYLYGPLVPERPPLREIAHRLWPRSYALLEGAKAGRSYRRKVAGPDFVSIMSAEAARVGLPQEAIDRWKTRLPKDLVAAVNRNQFNGGPLANGLLRPQVWIEGLDVGTPRAERMWAVMAATLTEIVRVARERRVQVAMVFMPHRLQHDASFYKATARNPLREAGVVIREGWLEGESEVQRRLARWSADLSVPFLDLTPWFRGAAGAEAALTYPLDFHWTPAGHRVAAAAIEVWLREARIFGLGD